jgi:cytochrome P450
MAMFVKLPKVPLPGPRTLPVIGGKLAVLRFFLEPVVTMFELHERYGNLVALSRNDPGWVCVFGSELNHAVLSKPDLYHHFFESPVRIPKDNPGEAFETNIISQNGDHHRGLRRMLMVAFTKERLHGYVESMVALTRARVVSWSRPGTLATREQMTSLAREIAMSCLFGLSMAEASNINRDMVRLMDLVLSPAAALFPVRIPGTPYDQYLTMGEQVDAELRALIERRRREPPGDDVFSVLIAARDEDGKPLTDKQLVGQATTMILSSYETTAMSLTWACLMLATHPEIQREVGDEVAAAIGDAPVTIDDLERMPLLGWVVDETLRLFAPTPNLFFRRSTADSTLAGHQLPAGSTLIVSPLITHRDPKNFPEPRRFLPRRWDGLTLGPYDYIPFGVGVRRCLGAGFAAQAMRLALATMMQEVRFSVPAPMEINYLAKGVVISSEGNVELELRTPAQGVSPAAAITGTICRLVELG